MILCVGSRNTQRPYCSRVCCTESVKNALRLKEENPQAKCDGALQGYPDVRFQRAILPAKSQDRPAYSLCGTSPQNPPLVTADGGKLMIKYYEPLLDAAITSEADLVVLASGNCADIEDNRKTAQFYKVAVESDGFFLEAHAKLKAG